MGLLPLWASFSAFFLAQPLSPRLMAGLRGGSIVAPWRLRGTAGPASLSPCVLPGSPGAHHNVLFLWAAAGAQPWGRWKAPSRARTCSLPFLEEWGASCAGWSLPGLSFLPVGWDSTRPQEGAAGQCPGWETFLERTGSDKGGLAASEGRAHGRPGPSSEDPHAPGGSGLHAGLSCGLPSLGHP